MTGSIAVSQCGHTPSRPGHHGTVVAKTVGSVAISCNVALLSTEVLRRPLRLVRTTGPRGHKNKRLKVKATGTGRRYF